MLLVAPSAIRPSGEAFIENENGKDELVPFAPPRALQKGESIVMARYKYIDILVASFGTRDGTVM